MTDLPPMAARERRVSIMLGVLLLPVLLQASTLLGYAPFHLWTYDFLRVLSVAAFGVVLLLASRYLETVTFTWPALCAAGAAIALMSASLALHYHPGGAAEVLLALTVALSGWLLSQLAHETDPAPITQRLALIVLLIATLYVVRGIPAWLPHCIHDGTCNEFYGNYLAIGNRRAFNQIQTGLVPFLLWLVMTRPRDRLRVLAVATTAVMVWMIVTTGGRGTAVALVASGLLMAWRYRWSRAQWHTVTVGPILGLALAGMTAGLQALMTGEAGDLLVRADDSSRLGFWGTAAEGALDAPLLGQGPGAFASLGHKVAHAHNVLADLAHDFGLVVALLATLFILASGLLALLRLPPAAQPVAWSACALLAHSLVSGLHIYAIGQTLLVIMLGLVWAWAEPPWSARWYHRQPLTHQPKIWLAILIGLLLSLLVTSLVVTFPDYGQGDGFVPRLWLSGRYALD